MFTIVIYVSVSYAKLIDVQQEMYQTYFLN